LQTELLPHPNHSFAIDGLPAPSQKRVNSPIAVARMSECQLLNLIFKFFIGLPLNGVLTG
jgi:hypothetical protein